MSSSIVGGGGGGGGGWWSRLASSVAAVTTGATKDAFPFRDASNSNNAQFQLGPFRVTEGVNTAQPAGSEYAKVSLWRGKAGNPAVSRVVKQMRTLQHPSMIKAIAVKEQRDEVIVATEFCVRVEDWEHAGERAWQEWAAWQLDSLQDWLQSSNLRSSDDGQTVLVSQSGECRVVLLEEDSNSNAQPLLQRQPQPPSRQATVLIQLAQDLQFLATMTPAQQVSLYARVAQQPELPPWALKHLLLPRAAAFRTTLLDAGLAANHPVSSEEVRLFFGEEAWRVCGGCSGADFMALLAGVCERFLAALSSEPVLLQLLRLLGRWCELMEPAWMAAQVLPHLMRLLSASQSSELRSACLACVAAVAPSCPAKALRSEVLRLLARAQGDSDPGIRLDAIRVLDAVLSLNDGRIDDGLRAKIVGPALCKALVDPVVAVRLAALRVFAAWARWIGSAGELAGKVAPVLLGVCVGAPGREEGEAALLALERVLMPRLRAEVNKKPQCSPSVAVGSASHSSSLTGSGSGSGRSVEITVDGSTGTAPLSADNSIAAVSTAAATDPQELRTTTQQQPLQHAQKPSKMRLGSIKKIT